MAALTATYLIQINIYFLTVARLAQWHQKAGLRPALVQKIPAYRYWLRS
jgi:hypothetical protein